MKLEFVTKNKPPASAIFLDASLKVHKAFPQSCKNVCAQASQTRIKPEFNNKKNVTS